MIANLGALSDKLAVTVHALYLLPEDKSTFGLISEWY